ncbi:MAG: hypothetical protein IIC20_07245, partial [Chloroflexi bacterium]|nr:hypothetical protein [Chloroflexota bacterium]
MHLIAWDEVPEEHLAQGIKRRIITGDKVMLGRLFIPKGARVPAHRHENEQISHVLSGLLRFVVAGETVKEQFENDLRDELAAVENYNQAIGICEKAGDNGSRELFKNLVLDEEGHVDYLEAQ